MRNTELNTYKYSQLLTTVLVCIVGLGISLYIVGGVSHFLYILAVDVMVAPSNLSGLTLIYLILLGLLITITQLLTKLKT